MPRATPLPLELPPVFSVASAVALGVSRNRLARGDLTSPYYGVRAAGFPEVKEELLRRCLEYAPRLKPWQFISHETALALIGAPTPEWPYRLRLHVSSHRPAREPRTAGLVGHRLQLRESATLMGPRRLPIEHPVRAWRQAAGLWSLDDLIAAADFLVSGAVPLATVEELRAEVQLMGDLRRKILTRALVEVRTSVRSPRETRLRLLLTRSGLPEPELNWVLRDRTGRFVAELDLAYPQWLVTPEYDGRVHADDPRQFAKDGDRWDRIRNEGWDHLRIMKHHMRGDGRQAVAKVRDALIKAGWRPIR